MACPGTCFVCSFCTYCVIPICVSVLYAVQGSGFLVLCVFLLHVLICTYCV